MVTYHLTEDEKAMILEAPSLFPVIEEIIEAHRLDAVVQAELPQQVSDPDLACGVTVARCRCVLTAGHKDPVHVCDEGCGGSWKGEDPDSFEVITWPTGMGGGRPFDGPDEPLRPISVQRGGIQYPTPVDWSPNA